VIPASYDDILALYDAAGDDRVALENAGVDHAHIISGDETAPLWFCGRDLVTCQRDSMPMTDLAHLVWRVGLVRRSAELRRDLRIAARATMAARFGLTDDQVAVTVEEYTAHAEITIHANSLRFEYRAADRPGDPGRLDLVEPCEACHEDLRRASIGPDIPWADLGEALARDRAYTPWACWTCEQRRAEQEEDAARYDYEPEPPSRGERMVNALEDIAAHLAAIREEGLPDSDQLAAFHDLLDERLDSLDDRLIDLVDAVIGAVDEPGTVRRGWQALRGLLPRRAARPGPQPVVVADEFAAFVAAAGSASSQVDPKLLADLQAVMAARYVTFRTRQATEARNGAVGGASEEGAS